MKKRTKTVWIALSIALIAAALVTGVTFALFSTSVNTEHYISTGELRIDVFQTSMTGNQINTDGTYGEYPGSDEEISLRDFEGKVFDIQGAAPGIHRTGVFAVRDAGSSVAYDLHVTVSDVAAAGADAEAGAALLEQVQVTVTAANEGDAEVSESFLLSEAADGYTVDLGRMLLPATEKQFTVKVEFLNTDDNNAAKSGSVAFAMSVTAVQVTPEQP